jgi:hypothetical protein
VVSMCPLLFPHRISVTICPGIRKLSRRASSSTTTTSAAATSCAPPPISSGTKSRTSSTVQSLPMAFPTATSPSSSPKRAWKLRRTTLKALPRKLRGSPRVAKATLRNQSPSAPRLRPLCTPTRPPVYLCNTLLIYAICPSLPLFL